ncbi:MAG: 30S ribosomal protein S12 methylthiotransferase RimO [Clostridiales bacterium]|nr:30S ribosomal protein S12 methylthiotransferase RimO [Clostridiales bacterium]
MLGYLRAAGHAVVNDPAEAEILIVNTCGFILPAKEESIANILDMAQYKANGSCKLLVATGCLVQRYREQLAEELPEVDIFLGVREYERLPGLIASKLDLNAPQVCAPNRVLTTPPYRAYLRIGDGCNNRCAYCAIPLIRGDLRSVPMETLINETKQLANAGVTELTLIAQDTSGYGRDLYGEPRLVPLLRALDGIDALKWIRVLYTYPDTVSSELLDTLAGGTRLIPYLDMPLQHINDEVLADMRRRGRKADICRLLDKIYAEYPDFTLRTTMMVGFPGETEVQFAELLQFLRDYPFDRVGAFAFSPEEDTPAVVMPGHISEEIKQDRLHRLMIQQQGISQARNARRVGQETEMLVERVTDTHSIGRTPWHAPDVDGVLRVPRGNGHTSGQYLPVRVTEADIYNLEGIEMK